MSSPMRPAATEPEPAPPKGASPITSQPRSAPWQMALLLMVATVALYWPVTGYDFINIDDPEYVGLNPHVVGGLTWASVGWAFTTQWAGLWHPLTWISHMLDCECFGLHPGWHHLTSLLLHAANTALLFVVLRTMTGALWRSAVVAALFALHPLHVESVAWVAERKDVLSTTFALVTLLAYHRYTTSLRRNVEASRQAPVVPGTNAGTEDPVHVSRFSSGPLLFYLLSLFLFACGLMSKPMTVTLPLVLLLLDYWPLNRMGNAGAGAEPHVPRWTLLRLLVEKLPFVVLAFLTCLITLQSGGRFGALPSTTAVPIAARLANATLCYAGYLAQACWPRNLVVYYPLPATFSVWGVAGAATLLTGISVAAFCLGRRWPFVIVGWLWYLVTLLPVIGLIQLANYSHADRYTYVPLIGVFIGLTWSVGEVLRHRGDRAVSYFAAAAGVVLLLCLVCARRQIGYWRESETLLRHALEVSEDNWFAHNKLGYAICKKGQTDEGIRHYQAAIGLKPDYTEAHSNLGAALNFKGQIDEAIRAFQAAIRLEPNMPDLHTCLAYVLGKKGQVEESIREYREALRLRPGFPEPHNTLGTALYGNGQIDEAIGQYEAAIRLKPDYADAHYNLSLTLNQKGRVDEAIHEVLEALRLAPGCAEPHNVLGGLLNEKGQFDEAIRQFQEALRLKPDYADAHYNFGLALLGNGQSDEAIRQFQEALRFKPDSAEAYYCLGVAYYRKGQVDMAISQYQEALRLRPGYAEARKDLEAIKARP
jgi:protein O-mannosyl-transferase